jgi:hypothetical protein
VLLTREGVTLPHPGGRGQRARNDLSPRENRPFRKKRDGFQTRSSAGSPRTRSMNLHGSTGMVQRSMRWDGATASTGPRSSVSWIGGECLAAAPRARCLTPSLPERPNGTPRGCRWLMSLPSSASTRGRSSASSGAPGLSPDPGGVGAAEADAILPFSGPRGCDSSHSGRVHGSRLFALDARWGTIWLTDPAVGDSLSRVSWSELWGRFDR